MTSALLAVASLHPQARAATIVQTFEAGEDTSAWNSTWTGGQNVTGFLDPGLGGLVSGGGASLSQSFSRDFSANTAGLDITTGYSISMYVQVGAFDGPAGGLFEIVDGDYGSGNAANLRVQTVETSPGVFEYHWQARSNPDTWLDLGINMELDESYHVGLTIDPETFTYAAAVQLVDGTGTVLDTGSLSGLAFDQNVIGNGQNGNLLFYIQASAGGTDVRVDNINIQGVPEPSALLLAAGSALALTIRRRS